MLALHCHAMCAYGHSCFHLGRAGSVCVRLWLASQVLWHRIRLQCMCVAASQQRLLGLIPVQVVGESNAAESHAWLCRGLQPLKRGGLQGQCSIHLLPSAGSWLFWVALSHQLPVSCVAWIFASETAGHKCTVQAECKLAMYVQVLGASAWGVGDVECASFSLSSRLSPCSPARGCLLNLQQLCC